MQTFPRAREGCDEGTQYTATQRASHAFFGKSKRCRPGGSDCINFFALSCGRAPKMRAREGEAAQSSVSRGEREGRACAQATLARVLLPHRAGMRPGAARRGARTQRAHLILDNQRVEVLRAADLELRDRAVLVLSKGEGKHRRAKREQRLQPGTEQKHVRAEASTRAAAVPPLACATRCRRRSLARARARAFMGAAAAPDAPSCPSASSP